MCTFAPDAVTDLTAQVQTAEKCLGVSEPAEQKGALCLLGTTLYRAGRIDGFRNRDLRGVLFADAAVATPEEAKRQAAKVTRLLGLLRAHGVIAKVSKTHRYHVTAVGRTKVTALLAARQADTEQLLKAA